ncbi:MAG: hypothetical protein JWR07_1182 [Nevskia sp.]|nr:hypothetical protein [Nevskia sp.]
MKIQIELALLEGRDGAGRQALRAEHARRLGLTGAEIDAACAGRSHEVRIAAAVALACVVRDDTAERIEQARARALRLGIDEDLAVAIEEMAHKLLAIPEAKAVSYRLQSPRIRLR